MKNSPNVITTSAGLNNLPLQRKTEGAGEVVLIYADPNDGVLYEPILRQRYAGVIFVFGDNAPKYLERQEALNKAILREKQSAVLGSHDRVLFQIEHPKSAIQAVEGIKHNGQGQAKILGGRCRLNVLGVPTCDYSEVPGNENDDDKMLTAKAKSYIDQACEELKCFIQSGYTVVIPVGKKGTCTLGTGRAVQQKEDVFTAFKSFFGEVKSRQPEGFQEWEVAGYIQKHLIEPLIAFTKEVHGKKVHEQSIENESASPKEVSPNASPSLSPSPSLSLSHADAITRERSLSASNSSHSQGF